jgi:hypothetical protein
MIKQGLTINEEDYDFGFSLVSEDEMKAREDKAAASAVAPHAAKAEDAEQRLNNVMKMVLPFLNNLAKDSEKDYIYWPDRSKKMKEFIEKLSIIAGS